ncbi:MAG: hypothetical protein WCQ70_07730 [Lentimicrobiaceae bacterium]
MKITKLFFTGALVLAITGLTLTSCQKDELNEGTNDYKSLATLSSDEMEVESVTNESIQDVEGIMSYGHDNGNGGNGGNGNGNGGGGNGGSGNGGNGDTTFLSMRHFPCNATIDTSAVINDTITITITYDGLSCNGRRQVKGQIQIRMQAGTDFSLPGASINIRYINLAVTHGQHNRTMTYNGSQTFTNVSGGYISMLGIDGFNMLVHRVTGTMNVTFDNGNTRTWNTARQRTYTGTAGSLILTVDGFGSADGYDNLVTWGINRNGEQFYTQITQSIVFRETCDWNPVSGIKVHQIPAVDKSATITYGYNSNYELITGDECPTYYRIDWVNGTYTGTEYVALP